MTDNQDLKVYKRPISAPERYLRRSPYAVVAVVARIRGHVSEELLAGAVRKVQQRHPNLRVRIVEDDDHVPWFTSEGAGEIPVEVIPRESDDQWIAVHKEASQVPFAFGERPAIRFILLQSPDVSEVIVLCHHILCDGLSLAYLARDLMVHLGDPAREVEVLPDPVPVGLDNMPEGVSLNAIFRYMVRRISKKWEGDEVFFDQEDYVSISKAYWARFDHRSLSVELSEAQTSALVDRCRRNGVTVNSALAAAFAGAQHVVQRDAPSRSRVGIGASVRDRLRGPVGQVMGYYAGVVTPTYKHDGKADFWENARRFHAQVQPLYTDRRVFDDLLTWCHLAPEILEATTFKMLGELVPAHDVKYDKLSAFGKRDDVISSILKRRGMDSRDKVVMELAVTNLTRMDFPRRYGALELDRLILHSGGAFPLSNVGLVVGAVTCSGKLSLVIQHEANAVDAGTVDRIRDRAMASLLND